MNKIKKSSLVGIFLFFVSAVSFSYDIFGDYRVNKDKLYLDKYNMVGSEMFGVKNVLGLSYEVTGSGEFNIRESGGRSLRISVKNGIVDGAYNEYYSNGRLYTTGKYENGKKEGEWKEYYESGRVWKVYNYQNGELHGKYTTYYNETSGQAVNGNYKNGLIDGIWTEYYTNGRTKLSGLYVEGKKTGNFIEWYENGTKKSEINHVDDEISGRMVVYYPNGVLMYEANINGRSGLIKGYSTNGSIIFDGRVNENRMFSRK